MLIILNVLVCNEGQPYNLTLKLSGCLEDEFTCNDGQCIDINTRCDQINDCRDESDEQECQLLVLNKGYNREVPPFSTVRNYKCRAPILFPISGWEENNLKGKGSINKKYLTFRTFCPLLVLFSPIFMKTSLNRHNALVNDNEMNELAWLCPRIRHDSWNVMMRSWKYVIMTSWKCCDDIMKMSSWHYENVIMTSWKCQHDIMKISSWHHKWFQYKRPLLLGKSQHLNRLLDHNRHKRTATYNWTEVYYLPWLVWIKINIFELEKQPCSQCSKCWGNSKTLDSFCNFSGKLMTKFINLWYCCCRILTWVRQ